jgi:hypothetical protein
LPATTLFTVFEAGAVKSGLRGIRNLTPGDFKTVHQRQQYSEKFQSPLQAVAALKTEVSYKRFRTSAIGFAA